jgi:hypothetical protein
MATALGRTKARPPPTRLAPLRFHRQQPVRPGALRAHALRSICGGDVADPLFTTVYIELVAWCFVALVPFDAGSRVAICNGFGLRITSCDDVTATARSLVICWLKVRFPPGSQYRYGCTGPPLTRAPDARALLSASDRHHFDFAQSERGAVP